MGNLGPAACSRCLKWGLSCGTEPSVCGVSVRGELNCVRPAGGSENCLVCVRGHPHYCECASSVWVQERHRRVFPVSALWCEFWPVEDRMKKEPADASFPSSPTQGSLLKYPREYGSAGHLSPLPQPSPCCPSVRSGGPCSPPHRVLPAEQWVGFLGKLWPV